MKSIIKISSVIIISFSCIMFLTVFICSFVYFMHQSKPSTIEGLAQFGDFISGTFGVFISFASLGLTGLIAYYVNNLQEKLANQSIINSKNTAQLLLRAEEFRIFKNTVDPFYNEWVSNGNFDTTIKLYWHLEKAYFHLWTLFPNSRNGFEVMSSCVTQLDKITKMYGENIPEDTIKDYFSGIRMLYEFGKSQIAYWVNSEENINNDLEEIEQPSQHDKDEKIGDAPKDLEYDEEG